MRFITFLLLPLIFAGDCFSQSPQIILQKMYPGSNIKIKNIILNDDQIKKIKEISGIEQDEKMISFYLVQENGKTNYYAYIDVHRVRTKDEAVLFIIGKNAEIEKIKILSFREPNEYKPNEKWLQQFEGKSLSNSSFRYKYDIDGISGATFSGLAMSENARKVLAIWKVIYGKG